MGLMPYYGIITGGQRERFKPGGNRRVGLGNGMALVQADIMAADGTLFDGILGIDENSRGELWTTYIMTPSGLAEQEDAGFLRWIGKTKEQFFPYRYRLRAEPDCEDIHTGDGWSL